jgi:DNA replication and repair protein RecF
LIPDQDELGSARLRKEIRLDGVQRKAGETVGAFNAVLFLPHMLRIVEGSPEDRRRYLNLAMGQVSSHFTADLTEYNRLLAQRNALLKGLGERGGDPSQLTFWDEKLAQVGGRLVHARIHAIRELERLARRIHLELTRNQEVLSFEYLPAFDPLPPDESLANGQFSFNFKTPVDRSGKSLKDIQRTFLERLDQLHSQEIQRGVTTIGPHRDELRFYSNGIDLGTYGSRGQGRTAVLSLKLAEASWMKEKTGQKPVLLLDEVLAELDPQRRQDLLQRLRESDQALLTTTDLDAFPEEFVAQSSLRRVSNGQVLSE